MASATQAKASPEALGALVPSATPMTVPVEPLGSHVAPASPTTTLPEAPGHALDAIAPATGRAGGLGPAHEAQCVEKREWSLAPCDDANVRSAKCALISAQKRPKAPKRPIALSPSPSPARPRARARACVVLHL